jgi:hypothetical protein
MKQIHSHINQMTRAAAPRLLRSVTPMLPYAATA